MVSSEVPNSRASSNATIRPPWASRSKINCWRSSGKSDDEFDINKQERYNHVLNLQETFHITAKIWGEDTKVS